MFIVPATIILSYSGFFEEYDHEWVMWAIILYVAYNYLLFTVLNILDRSFSFFGAFVDAVWVTVHFGSVTAMLYILMFLH